jgi:hypothetical protein
LIERVRKAVPDRADASTSKIMADVKRRMQTSETPPAGDNRLEAAAFLYFAQELDRQNQSLASDLAGVEERRREMLKSIHGPADEDGRKEPSYEQLDGSTAGGNYMIADRLQAWGRLIAAEKFDAALLVTLHSEVLDWVIEKAPAIRPLIRRLPFCGSGGTPETRRQWRSALMDALERMARNPEEPPAPDSLLDSHPVPAGTPSHLSVYCVPERSAVRVLTGISAAGKGTRKSEPESEPSSTLIAFIQP